LYIFDKSVLKRIYKYKKDKQVVNKYHYLYKWYQYLTYDEDHANSITSDSLHLNPLQKLKDEDSWTFQIGSTGRLYNPITNLYAPLKASLRCNHDALIQIDINSSIPFMSLSLFNKKVFYKNSFNNILYKYSNRLFDSYSNSSGYDGIRSNIHTWFMLGKIHAMPTLFSNYRDDILNNRIYEKVRDRWNNDLGKNYTRKQTKLKFLGICNSPSTFDSKEKDILKDMYPQVIKSIDEINGFFRTNKMGRKLGDRKASFAHYTQIVESGFVLDTVCKRISIERPDIPIYTIHDAILSIEEHINYITKVLEEESIRVFDCKCSYTIEKYKQPTTPV
jgi:hypothetical protein